MSRLQELLAKMDTVDVMDATPYLISNAGENVRHTLSDIWGIKWNLASIASMPSFTPLEAVDVHGCTPKYDDPKVMAETLLLTMRQIGLQFHLTAQDELRIEPSDMLWPYDWELIDELKPQLVTILEQEYQP